jgi:hypothetical protein
MVPFLTRPAGVVLQHYADWVAQQKLLANERWPGFRDAWTVWQVVKHTLTGELIDLKAPLDNAVYRTVQLVTAGSCLAWCLWKRRRGIGSRQLVLATLSMGSVWAMLFGPAVEYPTYVFLAPFLAAAVVDNDSPPARRFLAAIASVLILTFGWGLLSLRLIAVFPPVLAALPIGTALFAIGLTLSEQPRAVLRVYRPQKQGVAPVPVTSAAA